MISGIKWTIDHAHSEIGFHVRHLMIANVKGIFKKFDSSIYSNANNFAIVEIDVWIDVASIDTGEEKRDTHLKSAEFFNADKHKQINFISSYLSKPINSKSEMWGELTIIGVTKNIKLDVQQSDVITDPWNNERSAFTLTGKIKRSDWGLSWNQALETGGVLVNDEVSILCEIQLIKEKEMDPDSANESTSQKVITF